jgi:dipeptidyl-peptidase 4
MRRWLWKIGLAAVLPAAVAAQGRVGTTPGYERYQKMVRQIPGAMKSGALAASWTSDSRSIEFTRDGRRRRFLVATHETIDVPPPTHDDSGGVPPSFQPEPERGRQFISALSPDGRFRAVYKDRNIRLSAADGSNEIAVTTDGSAATRVKYGTASWVYGEELEQRTAMWWSPDSRKLAYYRFDEAKVPDYYVALDQTRLQDSIETEAYPTAGAPNPIVEVFIYDVATQQSTRVDVRSGKPFDDDVVGHYVYHVVWSPDGRDLVFFRTNRRQNVMEVAAANPSTGATRTILREEQPAGWVNDQPRLVFLRDGRRFIWESQRSGWDNFYLNDLDGTPMKPLTTSTRYEVGTLIKIDEAAGVIFYTARDGDSFRKLQLHRVGLDGTGERRLTDPAFHHSIGPCLTGAGPRIGEETVTAPCGISPDDKYFVDVYETHDAPPATRIVDAATGAAVAEVAQSDASKFVDLGLRKAELFSYTAADGRTPLHGLIQFPSTFDPARTYPVLVDVYGGPEFATLTARETFVTPSALAEYGFIILELDSRGVPGMGKKVLDSLYLKLGQAEVDDIAEGVKTVLKRPYIDRSHVGIFGTSYGGYVTLMEMLRHPDVFAAGAAASPVTDWRNYDSTYTERYMWTPQANRAGYDASSAVAHANALRGRLLLYFGTADNNVHPSNALQLIEALEHDQKSFDVQIGPDSEHSAMNTDRMMEFFVRAFEKGVGSLFR